jgi:cob(I)alamin adenosyltransferase
MTIYTKKGDKGKTGLYYLPKGKLISKDSLIIEAIGSIDEVNSWLGLVACCRHKSKDRNLVIGIQKDLMTINSILAGSKLSFPKTKTEFLEKEIVKLEAKLPSLKNFIIPTGGLAASYLHLARAVVRRAERQIIKLGKTKKLNPAILSYINRLSDLIFLLARKKNLNEGYREESWTGRKK